MERIILWSREAKDGRAVEIANFLADKLNVNAELASADEAAEILNQPAGINDKFIFISSDLPWATEQIEHAVSTAIKFNGHFGAFTANNRDGHASFPTLETSSLINQISESQTFNLSAIVVHSELVNQLNSTRTIITNSFEQLLLRLAIVSLGDYGSNDFNLAEFNIAGNSHVLEYKLNSEECSELLQFTLTAINIEDLFPNKPWKNHEAEIAATAYHTLAARFFKFNDHARAKECLQYGDQLEDSPRSLALKGLIALKEGEILTAVANMVSSLQEYEKRKGLASEGRYVQFRPNNLEVINSNLQNGLAALNKRENETAAEYFTGAVFEFDNFYNECGLTASELQ
jgi:hypothetical protein